MPKKVGFLYEIMLDRDLIRTAIKNGAKNKHKRWDVKPILNDIESIIDRIYNMLDTNSYIPSKPRIKEVYDSGSKKTRTIYVTNFYPDGIIHHLATLAMQNILERGMYHWSCASIPNRGGIHAIKKVKRILRNDPKNSKYVLKIDIKKYYKSIDHRILLDLLSRKIKDKRFLGLIREILKTCPKGLAIGYFICQWLANFYLETLDRYILTLPGIKYMIRYMDDIVMFGSNKKKLHNARKLITIFMDEKLRLTIKENWQVFPINSRMLDFVGYKFNHTHTTLRKQNFLRLTRQCRRIQKKLDRGEKLSFKICSGLLSRSGLLKHCNSHFARVKYIDPIGIEKLKEVVRHESKRRLIAARTLCDRRAA